MAVLRRHHGECALQIEAGIELPVELQISPDLLGNPRPIDGGRFSLWRNNWIDDYTMGLLGCKKRAVVKKPLCVISTPEGVSSDVSKTILQVNSNFAEFAMFRCIKRVSVYPFTARSFDCGPQGANNSPERVPAK